MDGENNTLRGAPRFTAPRASLTWHSRRRCTKPGGLARPQKLF